MAVDAAVVGTAVGVDIAVGVYVSDYFVDLCILDDCFDADVCPGIYPHRGKRTGALRPSTKQTMHTTSLCFNNS